MTRGTPNGFSTSTELDPATGSYRGSGEPLRRNIVEQLWRRALGAVSVLLMFWGISFTFGATVLFAYSPSVVWLEVPLLGAGAAALYVAVVILLNRTRITITPRLVQRRIGPLPWRGEWSAPLTAKTRIGIQRVQRGGVWGHPAPAERFRVVLQDDRDRVMFDHLDSLEAAEAVKALLETHVNDHQ